ncbi:MAG: hypothetical protein CM15mP118_1850 [Alphaproteobacteria bacterium]|nr:MAG: hypothetical protein CM15mP118_1850 [Alphaproteobacteria bacterium]
MEVNLYLSNMRVVLIQLLVGMVYSCSGSIFYNKDEILDDMTFACEFRDQEGSSFFQEEED